MLIDSHTHLPFKLSEAQEIINRAKDNGVYRCILIGTDLEENPKILELANNIPSLFAVIGVYPNSNRNLPIKEIIQQLETQIQDASDSGAKLVGIGECGIDISEWDNQRPVQEQKELFEEQVKLATKYELPIVIHNRNGDEHVLEILNKYKDSIIGVAHCFDSSWETAQKFLNVGFYISFSGFITFNSKKYLLETVENIPTDKFLIETDSPYITPKGIKERPNEPKNVKIVAEKVALVKNIPFEKIARISTANAERLFRLHS